MRAAEPVAPEGAIQEVIPAVTPLVIRAGATPAVIPGALARPAT